MAQGFAPGRKTIAIPIDALRFACIASITELRFRPDGIGGGPGRRGRIGWQMSDQDQAELRVRLARLEIEHEDLSHAIDAMIAWGTDALRIQRFKKKKLALKDEIAKIRARLIPDIIA